MWKLTSKTSTKNANIAIVTSFRDMGVGAILDSSLTAAVSRLKTAQEHILFVDRYFLSVYKTKRIENLM